LSEKTYRYVAERAWLALSDYVDSQGRVRKISTGQISLIGESIDYHSKHGTFSKDSYPSKNLVGVLHG
jgi:hypothetical protein